MLYNERAELILQQIQLQSTVKVNELSQLLQVSVDTVRRDLKLMEQNGLIKCVRGGACLPESLASISNFTGREVIHSDLKREAARKALAYIEPESVVALNSGTTNTILAQEMASMNEKFTVVTNNHAAVNILMQNPNIRLIAVGGMIDAQEQSTYGTVCEQEFAQYYPDIAFCPSMQSIIRTGIPISDSMKSASSRRLHGWPNRPLRSWIRANWASVLKERHSNPIR